MTHEALMALLEEVYPALRAAEVEPVLMGGLAVHLLTRRGLDDVGPENDPRFLDPTDPRRLATAIRVTRDIDVAVTPTEMHRAELALVDAGLSADPRVPAPPRRYQSSRAWVDLVPWPEELPLRLAREREQIPVRGLGQVAVAQPYVIVLLKVLAWTNRWEDRDLVDVARLALLDRNRGEVARQLARTSVTPEVRTRARQLADKFATPDVAGPGAFIRAYRPELLTDFDDDGEDDVRNVVHMATTRLLSGLLGGTS